MTTFIFGALWVHIAFCASLTGAFSLLLLAGPPTSDVMRRWERRILAFARVVSLVALASGAGVLAAQTSLFEGRPEAALELRPILRVVLETRPGLIGLAREGLLLVLAAFLFLTPVVRAKRDWIAARCEAFLLAALALVLHGASGHMAATSESLGPTALDMAHLLGAGIWAGGLPPLALLMVSASRSRAAPDPQAIRTLRRFSRLAFVTMLVLAASGITSAWILDENLVGLVGATHGRLLLAKLALLLPALALAALSRARLPHLSNPATARRVGLFIAAEAALMPALIGVAMAMSLTTPAGHDNPIWPFPFQISLGKVSAIAWAPLTTALAAFASAAACVALAFLSRRSPLALGALCVLMAGGGALALQPLLQKAYPTSFAASALAYDVETIAAGKSVYESRCASCHGAPDRGVVHLASAGATQGSAGDQFGLITHGIPERGMPAFGDSLSEIQRWQVVNFLRALDAASDPRRIGPKAEIGHAWLAAPDFTLAVGPLTPKLLSEFRGKRLTLVVLYDLPASRGRMSELAKRYGALSVLGVEVVAVQPRASPRAIADLGQSPPALFPVVTDGNEDIVAAYGLFAPGAAHAEFLIDRQGYIRAIWQGDPTQIPDADAVQAEVERLNEEKAPPPLPDAHVH